MKSASTWDPGGAVDAHALAVAQDPSSDPHDRERAVEHLSRGDVLAERLTDDEVACMRLLLRKALGDRTPVSRLELISQPRVYDALPLSVKCSRCSRFSDDEMKELADAIEADEEEPRTDPTSTEPNAIDTTAIVVRTVAADDV